MAAPDGLILLMIQILGAQPRQMQMTTTLAKSVPGATVILLAQNNRMVAQPMAAFQILMFFVSMRTGHQTASATAIALLKQVAKTACVVYLKMCMKTSAMQSVLLNLVDLMSFRTLSHHVE